MSGPSRRRISQVWSVLAVAALACHAGGGADSTAAEPASDEFVAPPTRDVLGAVTRELAPRNVSRTPERNEASPRFSPDGRLLAYETRDGSAQAIFVAHVDALEQAPQRVSSLGGTAAPSGEDALLGVAPRDESYNAELSFAADGGSFVFTGNGASGTYRLYAGRLGDAQAPALTREAREDGHPALSPDGRWLAYVSAREGVGKLWLRDLASGTERQLGEGGEVDLYPAWSPDSRMLAFTSGANDDHNIFVVRDVTAPDARPIALTRWSFDDLRPTFSPDGRAIAFYSNYDPQGGLDDWSIVVVPADGSGPSKGKDLAARLVATRVVKDLSVGPAWLPLGHALVYARNLEAEWNPIHVIDTETREERRIETATRMNHDVTCSASGLLAFRAQVQSWDDIFVAPLVDVSR